MPLETPGPASGDTAPDFALTGAGGDSVELKQFRGHQVLLIFYRGAW